MIAIFDIFDSLFLKHSQNNGLEKDVEVFKSKSGLYRYMRALPIRESILTIFSYWRIYLFFVSSAIFETIPLRKCGNLTKIWDKLRYRYMRGKREAIGIRI